MARKCSPYHSKDSDVYHIYSDCSSGNNIEKDKKKSGTGGKRLCSICKDMSAGERKR